MLDIVLSGACGRMGKAVSNACAEYDDRRIVAGIDINGGDALGFGFPIYTSLDEYDGKGDVIIDFSHRSALPKILAYAKANRCAVVAATTGYGDEELKLMKEASAFIPIFYSRNMSLGVNLLIELTKKATKILGAKYDIEIIEKHHNKKLDAPSGTALMIADAASSVLENNVEYVYDRQSVRKARSKNEIGISSVRGGTIVGDHDVMFCGEDEVITLSHSAYSRNVFASGALAAAEFIVGKPAGIYSMSDLIENDLAD